MVIHFICTTNSSKLSKPIAKLMVNPTAQKNDRQPNPTSEHFGLIQIRSFEYWWRQHKMGYILLRCSKFLDKTIL
jgi:hypothetical protein